MTNRETRDREGGSVNFRHLRLFWVVAREGSLVGASRRLGLSHSTISVQLQLLEKALGGKLLLRRPRGVRLTPLGETIQGYCNEIFRLGSEISEVAASRRGRSGRLRIGVLPSVSRALLYEALRPALPPEAGARIQVHAGDLASVCNELISGRMHAAVSDRLPSRPIDAPLHARVLVESRVGFFATRRLAERLGARFPSSLDGAPILMPGESAPLRDGLNAWFAGQGIRPRVVGEFEDLPTAKHFAAGGHGLLPLRRAEAEDTSRRYGLCRVGLAAGLVDRLYLLTLGRRTRHARVQLIIDRCRR
ncbi:MAG: LysR family transcriptional regulator [Gammaproteobacteria bacterium]|nr:LysR family transcriptional regulator [Gammaproteobacteria bacterium]